MSRMSNAIEEMKSIFCKREEVQGNSGITLSQLQRQSYNSLLENVIIKLDMNGVDSMHIAQFSEENIEKIAKCFSKYGKLQNCELINEFKVGDKVVPTTLNLNFQTRSGIQTHIAISDEIRYHQPHLPLKITIDNKKDKFTVDLQSKGDFDKVVEIVEKNQDIDIAYYQFDGPNTPASPINLSQIYDCILPTGETVEMDTLIELVNKDASLLTDIVSAKTFIQELNSNSDEPLFDTSSKLANIYQIGLYDNDTMLQKSMQLTARVLSFGEEKKYGYELSTTEQLFDKIKDEGFEGPYILTSQSNDHYELDLESNEINCIYDEEISR